MTLIHDYHSFFIQPRIIILLLDFLLLAILSGFIISYISMASEAYKEKANLKK